MEYRVLDQIADFEQALALEVAIWGLDPRDAVPVSLLRSLTHAGGLLLGAYDADQLVGISLSFPARSADRWVLWSHMTGIHRDYQARAIGFALKKHQRAWALANGYDEVRWTFDPLQRGNANFNLHRLGATTSQYHVNFYGVMADQINHADSPSDRIEAIWRLRDPRVERCLNGSPPDTTPPDCPFLLADSDGLPRPAPLDPAQPACLVQIPPSLSVLRHSNVALAWRLALRVALTTAFDQGYAAVDFTAANAYLLRHL